MAHRYVEKILRARVYDVARESPLDVAQLLTSKLNNRVLIKREDLQDVFSFKLRGAYNKMVNLSAEEKTRGVVAASAGNHAQGVALAADRLNIKAIIVMPRTTPDIKVDAVRARGVEAVLHGDNYDAACAHAKELAGMQGLVFVHPFDDPDVIAGQGTVGMEILRQHPDPIDAIFVPVGGGGLVAGLAAYVKSVRPEVKVVGVEPADAPSLTAAMAKGEPVTLERVGIFVDGAAVRRVGDETFRIAQECVDEVLVVTTDEICAAVKDIFNDTRTIAEPAGALALAGLKQYVGREGCRDRNLVAIETGANTNFDRLRHIAERAELGEQGEALFAVTVPEQPGSFLRFCRTIGQRSITEFNYRYRDAAEAHVFVGIKLAGGYQERDEIVAQLKGAAFPVVDLTEDETAKLHIRHMVGGHAAGLPGEMLVRFAFPERPGALLEFLEAMGNLGWSISLFHYRNHGAEYGRVLMGVQVNAGQSRDQFREFLDNLGYQYRDETENPAYRLFASGSS